MKHELNKIRSTNGYTPMAVVIAERIINHVQNGGSFGSNWVHYATGIVSSGKVKWSGWQQDEKDLRQGYRLAQDYYFAAFGVDLQTAAEANFNAAVEEGE